MEKTVTTPSVVIRRRPYPLVRVPQIAPSGPSVILYGLSWGTQGGARGNSVIDPSAAMRPSLPPAASPNQRAPSGPRMIPWGSLPGDGIGNSVRVPVGVIRPTRLAARSMNQRLPSLPGVISSTPVLPVGNVVNPWAAEPETGAGGPEAEPDPLP